MSACQSQQLKDIYAMNSSDGKSPRAAFFILDLQILIAIIAILAGLLLPALAKAKARARRISCVNNLKQVGLGFRLFSNDHGDKFPMALSTNRQGTLEFPEIAARHFQALSNELVQTRILVCPEDKRFAAPEFKTLQNPNVSYFVALDADETHPQRMLSGDRNLAIDGTLANTGLLNFPSSARITWTETMHRSAGNAGLSDGSVQQLTSERVQQQFQLSGMETIRLAVP